jgi:RimJ/RimL family protein N-acetyltransferase
MSEMWDQFATFAVVRDGRLIGTVNLDTDATTQLAMIGFAIGRAHWATA